jgi:hypothetical protein
MENKHSKLILILSGTFLTLSIISMSINLIQSTRKKTCNCQEKKTDGN